VEHSRINTTPEKLAAGRVGEADQKEKIKESRTEHVEAPQKMVSKAYYR
jgi:hypothetical protein